ncbi:hypothetical protein P7C70_g618, partial [Phenoliferia sp. Uapishka_3]
MDDNATASSSIHVKPYDPASDAPLTIQQQGAVIEEDPDSLLEELEADLDDEFDLGGFRERRMEELREQMEKAQKMKQSNYGRYTEMKVEKDVIEATAIIGFEELEGGDHFSTASLELGMIQCDVISTTPGTDIKIPRSQPSNSRRGIRDRADVGDSDEYDSDN